MKFRIGIAAMASALAVTACGGGKEVVTFSEYEQIHPGMSYGQVAAIIGTPGKEASSADMGGTYTVMYGWKNDDGSNMSAMFQNNKMVTKAQFGLE